MTEALLHWLQRQQTAGTRHKQGTKKNADQLEKSETLSWRPDESLWVKCFRDGARQSCCLDLLQVQRIVWWCLDWGWSGGEVVQSDNGTCHRYSCTAVTVIQKVNSLFTDTLNSKWHRYKIKKIFSMMVYDALQEKTKCRTEDILQ